MIALGGGRRRARRARGTAVAAAALTAACVAIAGATPAAALAQGRCGAHPWCDTSLSPQRRADLLVSALTPQERIGLLAGDDVAGLSGAPGTHTGTSNGVPRLGLPTLYLTDGPIGVRSGKATAMPASIALAASFDRGLARRYGALVGDEAKLKGDDLVYAPTVNILRTPLWGRAFESLGEDPFLTARMAVPYIRGVQAQGVIADVKHFAANNQEGRAQGGTIVGSRFTVSAEVGDRTLREIYLPAFEAAVKDAHVGSVMCAYNKLNGTHACENAGLLDAILRRQWGFKGFVLADYGASKHVDTGLRAGLDFEPWPFADFDGGENYTPQQVLGALDAGRIDQGLVDAAVRRVMRTLFAFGFFDRPPYVDDDSRVDKEGHRRVAQRIAERGAVLLRNRDGALPLSSSKLGSLAVIGADADRYVTGGGSSRIDPYSFTSVRAGIAARAGAGVDVRYDTGADLAGAADTARGADAAVVVVSDAAGEGGDKPCLALDCGAAPIGGVSLRRDALIDAVAAANPRTIVVLETAGPVLTPWRDRVAAILEAWYPGEAAGQAVAGLLFGDADPGGRLPATFPRSEADLPTAGAPELYPGVGDVARYAEGVLVGYRWYDHQGIAPAFPFGFGLSYTRFALRDLRLHRSRRGAGARVSVDVVNTGRRTGTAVPQAYVGVPEAPGRVEPPRRLQGFEAVELGPGRHRRVSFRLGPRAFSYWSTTAGGWRTAPGCYGISVGSSSRDIALRASLPLAGGSCRHRR